LLHGFLFIIFIIILLVNDQYDDQVFDSEEKSIDHDHENGNLLDWTLIILCFIWLRSFIYYFYFAYFD